MMRCIAEALRAAAHVLESRPEELPTQLQVRLMSRREHTIQQFVRRVEADSNWAWLKADWPTLANTQGSLLRTLTGHSDWVNTVVATDDGRVVSGSKDTTLRIWSLQSGKCERILQGHTDAVNSIALAPGRRIVSASSDKTLRVWQVDTGSCEKILEGHTRSVKAVVVTDDGHIVSGSEDKTVRIWQIDTGQCEQVVAGYRGGVDCLALDEETLVYSGEGLGDLGVLRLGFDRFEKFASDWGPISTMTVASDGRLVTGNESIRVWRPNANADDRFDHSLGERPNCWALACMPNDHVVAGTGRGDLLVFRLGADDCEEILRGHTDLVGGLAAINGAEVVSASRDNTLRHWKMGNSANNSTAVGHTDRISAISFLQDGGQFVSGSLDSSIRLWDYDTGESTELVRNYNDQVEIEEGISTLVATEDGLLVYGTYSKIGGWYLGEDWWRYNEFPTHDSPVDHLALTQQDQLVSGCRDGTIRIWQRDNVDGAHAIAASEVTISALTATTDGRVVSGSADCTICIWSIDAGELQRTLRGHTGSITALLHVDPDIMVSGSTDNDIRVWETETGSCVRALAGHTDSVLCLALIADGNIVSGSGDGTVRVWSIATGECVTVASLDAPVTAIASRDSGESEFVVGDGLGRLHRLSIQNSSSLIRDTSIITATTGPTAMGQDGRYGR